MLQLPKQNVFILQVKDLISILGSPDPTFEECVKAIQERSPARAWTSEADRAFREGDIVLFVYGPHTLLLKSRNF